MSRVIHFEIQADDIERVKKFYGNVFGWQISQVMKKEEDGPMNYWAITTGESVPGINGGLYERPVDGEKQFYFYDCTIGVPDLDEAIEGIKANGGFMIKEKMKIPGVGWFATAKDTEGNQF